MKPILILSLVYNIHHILQFAEETSRLLNFQKVEMFFIFYSFVFLMAKESNNLFTTQQCSNAALLVWYAIISQKHKSF